MYTDRVRDYVTGWTVRAYWEWLHGDDRAARLSLWQAMQWAGPMA